MREIAAQQITDTVRRLCIQANCHLPRDVRERITASHAGEPWPQAREILERIVENYEIADGNDRPICQDTGMACVFLKVGQEVHINGDVAEAIHEGVRQGYSQGYLRKSVVGDPLNRVNTGDNTPAMIYYCLLYTSSPCRRHRHRPPERPGLRCPPISAPRTAVAAAGGRQYCPPCP